MGHLHDHRSPAVVEAPRMEGGEVPVGLVPARRLDGHPEARPPPPQVGEGRDGDARQPELV
jgi:hypothetical protein